MEGGCFDEAEKVFQKVLNVNPDDLDTYNRMGIALRQQKRYEEAEHLYMRALKMHPQHAGFYHNLGVVYIAWKQLDKAEKCFKRALNLDPESEASKTMLEKIAKGKKPS